MNKPVIKIDIVSDVVCPWCYIGKRRLEQAMDQLKDNYDFQVQYLPFELNPNTPKEGYDQKAYLSNKFGGEERYDEITNHTTSVASEDGLEFNFDIQKKSPNTFDAHRIIWFSSKKGKQWQTTEAFFQAYFTNGVDLTKTENLVAIAGKAGLDETEIVNFLKTTQGVEEVKGLQNHSKSIGVTGVPFYIINNKYAVSGAQPAKVFIEAIPDIASKSSIQGESCAVDGNC